MKITNRMRLPQALVDAVKNDGYSKGDADISVTSLLSPPRKIALEIEHKADLEEDASDHMWSLLGQSIHTILERANREAIAERRLSVVIEGWKVSGGMDAYYESGLLQDYKTVTAYKFKGGKAAPEYEQQLNCYAEILRQNGDRVEKLQVVGILRDWSKLEARRDANYPQAQVVVVDVPLWSEAEAQRFMRERVILHKQARVSLPECSSEERWARPTVFAVMKAGRKSAVRLFDNAPDAEAFAGGDKSLSVVVRPGQQVRCENYCSVSKFCSQFQQSLASEEAEQPAGNEVTVS